MLYVSNILQRSKYKLYNDRHTRSLLTKSNFGRPGSATLVEDDLIAVEGWFLDGEAVLLLQLSEQSASSGLLHLVVHVGAALSRDHKVFTYVECRAVSGVFQNIDLPPPLHPASVSSPQSTYFTGGETGSVYLHTLKKISATLVIKLGFALKTYKNK